MPASLLLIQWRTSKTSIFFLPPSSNSKVATCVFGVSWSSSNMKCPPIELIFVGYLTPSSDARRAAGARPGCRGRRCRRPTASASCSGSGYG